EAQLEPPLGRPTAALIELAVGRIDEQWVVRCVELEVRGAQAHQLIDVLAEQFSHVVEELLQVSIGGDRPVGIPEVGEEAGARKRHLDDAVGTAAHVCELLSRKRPLSSKPPSHSKW